MGITRSRTERMVQGQAIGDVNNFGAFWAFRSEIPEDQIAHRGGAEHPDQDHYNPRQSGAEPGPDDQTKEEQVPQQTGIQGEFPGADRCAVPGQLAVPSQAVFQDHGRQEHQSAEGNEHNRGHRANRFVLKIPFPEIVPSEFLAAGFFDQPDLIGAVHEKRKIGVALAYAVEAWPEFVVTNHPVIGGMQFERLDISRGVWIADFGDGEDLLQRQRMQVGVGRRFDVKKPPAGPQAKSQQEQSGRQ